MGNDELEFGDGNSWMHEYVYKLLPAVLAATTATDDAHES
jgi:hypothetical protein